MFAVVAACTNAPDGQLWIVRVREPSGPSSHFVVAEDTGLLYPTWSPDGAHIAFQFGRTWSKSAIGVLDLQSRAKRLLIRGVTPAWSPDGGWIAYVGEPSGLRADNTLRLIRPDGLGAVLISEKSLGLDVVNDEFVREAASLKQANASGVPMACSEHGSGYSTAGCGELRTKILEEVRAAEAAKTKPKKP